MAQSKSVMSSSKSSETKLSDKKETQSKTSKISKLSNKKSSVSKTSFSRLRQPDAIHADGSTILDGRRQSQSIQEGYKSYTDYENTYKLGPDVKFSSSHVSRLTLDILEAALADIVYDTNNCKELCYSLVNEILQGVMVMNFQKYKFVAIVMIGSLEERPALQSSSRWLWDSSTDTFASVTFTNDSLFSVATVYALYQD